MVWARSNESAEKYLGKNCRVDQVEENPASSVKGSDLVILCTPVETIASILESIVKELNQHCLVTDVGSVKVEVCTEAKNLFKFSTSTFIGSHPMAGSEKNQGWIMQAKVYF